MKRPFTIFLDSSCPISKQLYPENTNTDFIIELPERLNFRQNWTVTLKTLFLSNKIQNIEDCHVQYTKFTPTGHLVGQKTFTLKNGNYGSSDNRNGDKRKLNPNLAPNYVPFGLSE